jgi:hypothetical protein
VGGDTHKYLQVLAATGDKDTRERYFGQGGVGNNMVMHTAEVHVRGAPEHVRRLMKEEADRQTAKRKVRERQEDEKAAIMEVETVEAEGVDAELEKPEEEIPVDDQEQQETEDKGEQIEDLDMVTYAQYQGYL